MKKSIFIPLTAIAGIAIVIACNTTKTTTKTTTTTTETKKEEPKKETASTAATYNGNVKAVLSQSCTGCHGYGSRKGDFTTYAGVKAKVSDGSFQKLVIEKKTMPPREPLSAEAFATLKSWVDAGAPEN